MTDSQSDQLVEATERAETLINLLTEHGIVFDLKRTDASQNPLINLSGDQIVEFEEQIKTALQELEQLLSSSMKKRKTTAAKSSMDAFYKIKDTKEKETDEKEEAGDDTFQKVGDSTDKNKQDKPPNDKYLYWEPENLMQKVDSFFLNSMETIYVIIISAIGLAYSSVPAVMMFLLALPLLVTSLQNVRKRVFWGRIVLGFHFAVVLTIAILKFKYVNQDTYSSKSSQFISTKKLLESWGFTLTSSDKACSLASKPQEEGKECIYMLDYGKSFALEIGMGLLILVMFAEYQSISRQIKKLTDPDQINEIDEWMTYNEEQEEEAAQAEAKSKQEYNIGTSKVQTRREIEEAEKREKQKKKKKDEMAKRGKKIPRMFIDTDHFYRKNQVFFICMIAFELFQSMVYNSAVDIPALFMLLFLFAFYAYRKVYTRLFLKFTFVLVYFIQVILVLKLINQIIIGIDYITQWMDENRETSTFVKINELMFGFVQEANEQEQEFLKRLFQYVNLYCCFYACQAWKSAKWMEIRFKTQDVPADASTLTVFRAYLDVRTQGNLLQTKIKNKMKNAVLQGLGKASQKDKKKQVRGKFDSGVEGLAKKASQDSTAYLPTIVLWTSRVLMFVLVYLYHSEASVVNLIWILLSFLLSQNAVLMLSIFAMIPLLSWQFVLIYGVRIPGINKTWFFQTYGKYYNWEMKAPAYEQSLMFLTLACFFMMISIQQIVSKFKEETSESMLNFFRKKCINPNFSDVWKLVFFSLRHVQAVVLLYLFINGISRINNFKNLGYMVFFVMYTAYEAFYRKTCILLLLFISFFILGQYVFSFIYPLCYTNKDLMTTMQWFSLYPPQFKFDNPFNDTNKNNSLYWRVQPEIREWIALIAISFLTNINMMYENKEAVHKLEEQISDVSKDKYKKSLYYYHRVERIVKSMLVYSMLIVMIVSTQYLEISFIQWVFFALTSLNIYFNMMGLTSISQLNKIITSTLSIKLFALIIMILEVLFIAMIGEHEKVGRSNTLDQKLKAAFPNFYANLDILGFRVSKETEQQEGSEHVMNQQSSTVLQRKFIVYTLFFLASIYLHFYYQEQQEVMQADQDFDEGDYKKLFEFNRKLESLQQRTDNFGADNSKAAFKKKNQYNNIDLIDFYERKRFTLAFMVYRAQKFWPFIDIIALHGHIFSNFAIVYAAIYLSVSFFSCFNILCMCAFYMISAQKVHSMANFEYDRSGLQSQCDVRMAQIITKRYKNESFQVFVKIRQTIWTYQTIILLLIILMTVPSELIKMFRDRAVTQQGKDKYEQIQFWMFMAGLGNHPYFLVVLIALIFEKQCLHWLANRCGCTHYNFQKFIELDIRRDTLRYSWPNPEYCKYDIENYRKHYFANDFDQLKEKIIKMSERDRENDFIPLRVAQRVRDAISFSVKLDVRCSDIKFDQGTLEKISEAHEHNQDYFSNMGVDEDYEDIPVLKEHKIKTLEMIVKQSVNRKYKLSFYKGMQIALEGLIMLLLMVSIAIKGNIYALIYLTFIFKFALTKGKTQLLVRINIYMSVCFFVQYFLYTLNLTQHTSPVPYPDSLKNYPKNEENKIKYSLPWFFHYEAFKDLRVAYLLGIGVDKDQLYNLMLDFVNLFCVTTYILTFRNPVLLKEMVKVFWQFPTPGDRDQWERLDPKVQDYVKWLFSANNECQHLLKEGQTPQTYKKEESNFPSTTLKNSQVQAFPELVRFAQEYNGNNKVDLNQILTIWVDLKYDRIWSQELIKAKKNEIKINNTYFRLVKQGSQLVYLTFHIFTILIVLLSCTMRQSAISIGYVLILLPFLKEGSEVLSQRDVAQIQKLAESRNEVETELKLCEKRIAELENESEFSSEQITERQFEKDRLSKLKVELAELNLKEKKLNQQFKQTGKKTHGKPKEWAIIKVIKVYLLTFGIADFTLQILRQMPLFEAGASSLWVTLGFFKVWDIPGAVASKEGTNQPASAQQIADAFSYDKFIGSMGSETPYQGLQMQPLAFGLQLLNCLIITAIVVQGEIFISPGYRKYMSQTDGSLDLLVQLAELKAKSVTYVYNNKKLRQIVAIQRKKELINGTLEKVRSRIITWRRSERAALTGGAGAEAALLDKLRGEMATMGKANKEDIERLLQEKHDEKKNEKHENKVAPDVDKDAGDGTGKIDGQPENIDDAAGKTDKKAKNKKAVGFTGVAEEVFAGRGPAGARISVEDSLKLQKKLAGEFVKAKLLKMNSFVRLYLWLQRSFTTQILFKNERAELQAIVREHAAGEIQVPTELEKIMTTEACELIQQHYDNRRGREALTVLLARARRAKQVADLLQGTDLERLIKLKDMRRTWDFTRPVPMLVRLVETFFYVLISQTQNILYLCMIWSMYQNAGLLSLFYPLAVFGYALLEETRPRREFWTVVRQYTTVIMFIKFVLNLQILESLVGGRGGTYVELNAWVQFGFTDSDEDLASLTFYMLPEVTILCFLMLNEIRLRLLGLYFEIEEDIETISSGIDRALLLGDEVAVKRKKLRSSNMCLQQSFIPLAEQIALREEGVRLVKSEIKDALLQKQKAERDRAAPTAAQLEAEVEQEYKARDPPVGRRELQRSALKVVSAEVWKQSRAFDLDLEKEGSVFDIWVQENVLQKTLEHDNFLYVEGQRQDNEAEFMTREEFQRELDAPENWENMSAGAFEEDFGMKFGDLDKRTAPTLGAFDKKPYFEHIFPALRIQKPGYDLYGATTTLLALTAVYVFWFYQNVTVDPAVFGFLNGQSSLFGGEMALVLLVIFIVMLFERYTNRTDTKAAEKARLSQSQISSEKEGFFKAEELFQRANTARSMTVKIRTAKTSDIDMAGTAAQDFLQQMQKQSEQFLEADQARTKITTQQKTKFVMHWVILVGVHVFIFWYVPIHGNTVLYGSATCDRQQEAYYGCKDFASNPYTRVLYLLFCVYLTLSALQLRWGFPIMKKASSVLQYYNSDLALLGAQIYNAIPFALELRCVFDFTMSKTSLDVFQYWQLYLWHSELYIAKNGNRYYGSKRLGREVDRCEKCTFGVSISLLILILLIGPFILFSEYGGLTVPNPVTNAGMELSLILTETADGTQHVIQTNLTSDNENDDIIKLADQGEIMNSSRPYLLYTDDHAYLRTFTENDLKESNFAIENDSWAETRSFKASQIQECLYSTESRQNFAMPQHLFTMMKKDLYDTVKLDNRIPNNQTVLNRTVSLGIQLGFERTQPATAKKAGAAIVKSLNFSQLDDCLAANQLQKLAELDCKNPTDSVQIEFTHVITPYIVLGQMVNATFVERLKASGQDNKMDLQLTYNCIGHWEVKSRPSELQRNGRWYNQTVDPLTCRAKTLGGSQAPPKDSVAWAALKLTLFSVLVAGSIIASYNPSTFFLGITLVVSAMLRPAFMASAYMAWLYECTNPDPFIKICEACYLKRHEEDLAGEEEAYRLMQELLRTHALFKAISGSSLRGPTDPALDKLTEEEKKKLARLEELEQKGFDMKDKIDALKGRLGVKPGENMSMLD